MDKETFRKMSLKQKIEWYLQYYGLATLVTIIIGIVLINFVITILFKTDEKLNVLIYDDRVSVEMSAKIAVQHERVIPLPD